MYTRKDITPNNLKAYRLKAGLRQIDVAKELGFATEERISYWEQGKKVPDIFNLFKLAKLYQTKPESLYIGYWNNE